MTPQTYTSGLRRLDSLLAIAYFDSNIICVAAAGNTSSDELSIPAVLGDTSFGANYPAAWRDSNRVLGVGSIESNNNMCNNSTYGARVVDFGAPGTSWTTDVYPDTGFGYTWGGCATSWAAPEVAGIAGLVKSAYPSLPKDQVILRMREGCQPMNLTSFRSGNIDALKALSRGPAPPWGPEPIELYEDFIVAPGETLYIYPFTKVSTPNPPRDYALSGFDTSRVEIIVYGTIIARGMKNYPIIFQGDTTGGGGYADWGGIVVRSGGKAILDTVIIRNATTGIRFDTAGVCSLRAVTIDNCQSFGIDVASRNISIRNTHIRNISDGYGIRVGSGAKVNLFADTIAHAYGGIEFYETAPCTLQASLIDSCNAYGIYTQSDSLAVSWTTIHDISRNVSIRMRQISPRSTPRFRRVPVC
ncbi:MAG: S8 family serine peptidase [candidate division Zixibacteria bacterium]|nr:S8 family serine peptidase [candidate division Zixibacteria bacterium]